MSVILSCNLGIDGTAIFRWLNKPDFPDVECTDLLRMPDLARPQ